MAMCEKTLWSSVSSECALAFAGVRAEEYLDPFYAARTVANIDDPSDP